MEYDIDKLLEEMNFEKNMHKNINVIKDIPKDNLLDISKGNILLSVKLSILKPSKDTIGSKLKYKIELLYLVYKL